MAVAFTAFDGQSEAILDPSYGELVFKLITWDDNYNMEEEVVPSHVCSEDELGLSYAR